MITRTRLAYLASLLVLFNGLSFAEDREYKDEYEAFEKNDLRDPVFSNQAAIDVVRKAIRSEDLNSIEHMIRGLGVLATQIYIGSWVLTDVVQLRREITSRSFEFTPELKYFLIHYWNTNNDASWQPPDYESMDIDDDSLDTEEFEKLLDFPVWLYVPKILATFYPEDKDVYEFIWKNVEPDNPASTLNLLNIGKYRTEKATNLRIELLNKYVETEFIVETERSSALYNAKLAVTGLGRHRSPIGLLTLSKHLDRKELLPTIVTAIAAHGANAKPYIKSLTRIREDDLVKRGFGSYQEVKPTIDFLLFLVNQDPCCLLGNKIPLSIYQEFEEVEIFNRNFPNKTVHPLIQITLANPRPEIHHHMLRGLGRLSTSLEVSLREHLTPVPPMRRLSDVSGLKELLIKHWTDGLNTADVHTNKGKTPNHHISEDPGWQYVPEILSIHYPRDEEVHDFLWSLKGTTTTYRLLRLLNNSQDTSSKANELRLYHLHSDKLDVAKEAAIGLGWFPSPRGLNALSIHLDRRDELLPVIINSLVAYGTDAKPIFKQVQKIPTDASFALMPQESRENILSSIATLDYIIKNPQIFDL